MKKLLHESSTSAALLTVLAIGIILLVLVGLLSYNLGQANPLEVARTGSTVKLAATGEAQEFGLAEAEVAALVNVQHGQVDITLTPRENFSLPLGTYLAAYLVDGAQNGAYGLTSSSPDDELFSGTLSDSEFAESINSEPFFLALGSMNLRDDGTFFTSLDFTNTLSPYDSIIVTLEGDRATADYDPRPSTVLFDASIPDTIKPRAALREIIKRTEGETEEE